MTTIKSLVPPTADRSLKGRIAQSQDLLARLKATAADKRAAGLEDQAEWWDEMVDECAARILEMQIEGRRS